MSFCSNCEKKLADNDKFCSGCGFQIGNNKEIKFETNNVQKDEIKGKHNPFTKFIILSVIIQVILYMYTNNEGVWGGIAFLLAIIFAVITLILSIMSVVKSKKYNKGKISGIIFAILSCVPIVLFIMANILVMNENSSNSSDEMKYINECVNNAADISVETLKNMAKDPSSLKINNMYAIVYDTRITAEFSDGTYYDGGEFQGYIEVYIDFTGTNGFGGVGREYYYFKFNQDMKLMDSKEVEAMPSMADDVWVIDTKQY